MKFSPMKNMMLCNLYSVMKKQKLLHKIIKKTLLLLVVLDFI